MLFQAADSGAFIGVLMTDRLCDIFLRQRGALLGDHGFAPDPARVERTAAGETVVYHYTRPERMQKIMAAGDLCLRMMRGYVGDLLLRITLPAGFPGVYVAEMAHNLECKFQNAQGRP